MVQNTKTRVDKRLWKTVTKGMPNLGYEQGKKLDH